MLLKELSIEYAEALVATSTALKETVTTLADRLSIARELVKFASHDNRLDGNICERTESQNKRAADD